MVICVPGGALSGKNPVTTGAGSGTTVKVSAVVVVPPSVVRVRGPDVAPTGTIAISASTGPIKLAGAPLNVIVLTVWRLVPEILTTVPGGPLVGLKLQITGGGLTVTVKISGVVNEPVGEVIVIGPVVAPLGTSAKGHGKS